VNQATQDANSRAGGGFAARQPLFASLLLTVLCGAAYAQSASTQAGTAPEAAQALEPIAVTGTLIRSADRVGFNQVQVIQAADIADSGATTVSEFLRELAVNSASSWGDDFAYGATGGAGIALRGLSEKYTLVLVDGQRAAPFAEPSNGTDSFVDLNSIPLGAIQRIEVVKTGAVSQYGSDAIAGVVNIITKKNVTGLELGAGYGQAVGATERTRKLDVIGGWGDLARDRFNVTATGSFFLQDGYTLADRSLTQGQNYSNLQYGVNTQGADYWEPNGVGNGGAALSPCPSGGSVASGATILNGPGSGSVCAVNTADGTSLHPHEQRVNGKIHATFAATDDVQAFADFWDSHNVTITRQGFNSIGDGTEGYDLQNVSIFQVSNVVPASNPYNPYGVAAPLTYTFLGQPQILTTTSNFYRASAGAEGSLRFADAGEWTWSASVSRSLSSVGNFESGLLSVAGLQNILANGVFDFANPSATPAGLQGLYSNDQDSATYRLDTFDASAATSNLARLPAGDVGLGAGVQFRREGEFESDFSNQAAGLAVPFFLQAINGQRNVAAVYYQLNVPVLSTLSFTQSSRYDHYSDFGSAFSPRFALRLQPVKSITTYASYSRGFRAPTLAENSQSNSSGIQQAIDPYSPVNSTTPQAYPVLVRGNPDLSPEHTRNYNLGLEFSPDARTSVGLDWYKVTIENVIGTGSLQALVDANNPSIVVRNANGTIAYVNFDFENLNTLDTDGIELTFRKRFSSTVGEFTAFGDVADVLHFRQTAGGVTQDFAGNDGAINTPFGASFPHVRGNVGLKWDYQGFATTATLLYTGPYEQTQEPGAASTPSFTQLNLVEAYTGWKNWTVSGTIKNAFNRQPPYYPLWLYFPTHAPFDQSLYSDEGRYLELDVRYRF
jgi:iron complex outermembrane receptor protein